ncbi:40S ribosomal protein S8 [Hibiscus syriacus]|uniref:40S ribosomal protein S8 n=1 Tax=Hibiscus syriacus TaxID=106335 RepID=A0A6A2Y3J3_HIBSY|nr:40S ribosomal protein S8 [Hibiscus syriacus]
MTRQSPPRARPTPCPYLPMPCSTRPRVILTAMKRRPMHCPVAYYRLIQSCYQGETATEEVKKSNHALRKLEKRQQSCKLDPHIEDQFSSGRLLACISSRPGQCGRADGHILEGKELEFYMKKIQKKKGKGAA